MSRIAVATAAAVAVLALVLMVPSARAQEAPPPPAVPAPEPLGPERFAPEIAHFAELDASAPAPACPVLFVGSSSIRFWRTLDVDMAPFTVLNRGLGGARISDVNFYFDQVVAPYAPRAIVFYAGENDLWAGEPVEGVVADFQRFMEMKTAKLGETPVYFLSLKPSKLRLAQLPLQAEVNQRVKAMTASRRDLRFVDVTQVMMDQGAPKDIYVPDGLHMTPAGYALWTEVVRPVVAAATEDFACPAPAMKATP